MEKYKIEVVRDPFTFNPKMGIVFEDFKILSLESKESFENKWKEIGGEVYNHLKGEMASVETLS